jgi:hypothetical protein
LDIVAIRKATILKKRPVGVTVAAVLTIFTALAFGFLQILIIGLSAVGGPPSRPSGLPPVLLFPSLVAVLVFVLSVGQLDGARWAWYGSIVFWVCCLIGFGWFAYMVDFSHGVIFLDPWGYFVWYSFIGFLLTLVPLVYAAGCIRYFFTRNVRDYFLTDFPTNK